MNIPTSTQITLDDTCTADELLTALSHITPGINRFLALVTRSLPVLREAADLCGVDATDLTKRQAITAIEENF